MVERIVADLAAHDLEPDGRDLELLGVASCLADLLDELEAQIAVDGLSTRLKSGRITANPAVGEARMVASALARVLAAVGVEDTPAKNAAKVKAA